MCTKLAFLAFLQALIDWKMRSKIIFYKSLSEMTSSYKGEGRKNKKLDKNPLF